MRRQRSPLRAATVGAAALALTAAACQDDEPAASSPTEEPHVGAPAEFVTRPELTPPLIEVETSGQVDPADDDLMLVAPKGEESPMNSLLIADAEGEPVWIQDTDGKSYDFRVQQYEGEPVLTYWRGESREQGYGIGEFVILDTSYEEIATVTTKGTKADLHEMTITDDGTAFLVSYPTVGGQDLTELDGPRDGYVLDGVIQEIDIATGEVLWEWSALDHVELSETLNKFEYREKQDGSKEQPFDYFHINSVTEDGDHLLASARSTHAIYRIDRRTGEVDWTLGGSASDFEMDDDAVFAWQHDAQRQPDGTITLFDNESSPAVGEESRGMRLDVDTETMTARVVTEYLPPDGRLAPSQGNLQVRENGNVVIGWGSEPFYSEYTADGELLTDWQFSGGQSYRAYRFPWRGQPSEPPAMVVEDGTAWVSWNGATDVASWRFLAGADADSATEVATVERDGFETSAEVPDEPYVAVEALDADGEVLATAEPEAASDGS